MNHKNKNFIKILLVVLVFVIAGVIYSCSVAKSRSEEPAAQALPEETEEETTEAESESRAQICVHVCGAVRSPGVYFLDEGARVHEAVELAGGMTEFADPHFLNLAKVAEDGTQIYIPTMEETANGTFSAEAAGGMAADDGLVNINTAGIDELKTLPGIGDIKAEAILSYRESVGAFSSVEDIMNVAGIKESSYEKIKNYIKV